MRLAFIPLVVVVASVLAACPEPKSPESVCSEHCAKQLAPKCDDHACDRGCLFVLDRLVEKEEASVLSCLATQKTCDDQAWADCAARVGVHADGGPAAPPPPPVE